MAHYLLTGAGFSRNWGGWLASEAFEYLLGRPEVIADSELRQLLWNYQPAGGFEGALAELTLRATRSDADQARLVSLRAAISAMFSDMNSAFLTLGTLEFDQRWARVGEFLARFDQIFTLNQDILLEHLYCDRDVPTLAGSRRWAGAELPGMRRLPQQPVVGGRQQWATSRWTPANEEAFRLTANLQPIFKLHGSSNWVAAEAGGELLIMGGGKAREIENNPLLRWYLSSFQEAVRADAARLMVIGYGFRDQHVNDILEAGVARGLRLLVIAPEGADIGKLATTAPDAMIRATTREQDFVQKSLIGASRRSLHEIFGNDTAEHAKVMRFFSE